MVATSNQNESDPVAWPLVQLFIYGPYIVLKNSWYIPYIDLKIYWQSIYFLLRMSRLELLPRSVAGHGEQVGSRQAQTSGIRNAEAKPCGSVSPGRNLGKDVGKPMFPLGKSWFTSTIGGLINCVSIYVIWQPTMWSGKVVCWFFSLVILNMVTDTSYNWNNQGFAIDHEVKGRDEVTTIMRIWLTHRKLVDLP